MPPEECAPRRAVAGVVLAAGSSTRMGANKLLIEVDGEVLVARTVRRAAAAGLDPVVVVLGHESDRVARALDGVRCRAVVNAHHRSGQGSSFRCGIAAVPDQADAAVVLLADMPMVTADMIAAVVDLYRATGAPLVLSEYAGVSAPPTLYDRSLFPEIAAGDGCGREIVERHRKEARSVAWPAERLADLDEPGDLERFRADERCAPSF
jgi:molybdenum cofactor cytidylyltransferase